ncbi:MAG: menaquinone biosynthesis protein [Longimicrobiales bacterium]
MIRLGHIDYSNCFPVHARLLAEQTPADVQILTGVPAVLNRALAAGEIDVAPCSSIEYARHAPHYRILPDFVIGSDGPVQSIRFDASIAPERLDGATVFVTDSSATSVVLLRILLERCWGVTPNFETFDQTRSDPLRGGAAAALFIGDVALLRSVDAARFTFDLGEEWTRWTNLPFAFAVWQARTGTSTDELARLTTLLQDSREYFRQNRTDLAERFAPHFHIDPQRLLRYWDSLRYDLDESMRAGLRHFLALAAELGEAPPVPQLEFVTV